MYGHDHDLDLDHDHDHDHGSKAQQRPTCMPSSPAALAHQEIMPPPPPSAPTTTTAPASATVADAAPASACGRKGQGDKSKLKQGAQAASYWALI